MDKIKALTVFCQIAETSSFSKTAKLLNLPRSSVTSVIQSLEDYFNTRLIYRTTRQVSLTSDGERLYRHSQDILENMSVVDNLFKNDNQFKGKLKIAVPSRIASRIIIPALSDFCEQYPQLYIEIESSDLRSNIIGDGIDCVIRAGTSEDSNIISQLLGSFNMIVCASPQYIKRYGEPAGITALSKHRAVHYAPSGNHNNTEVWEFYAEENSDSLPASEIKKSKKIHLKGQVSVNHVDSYIACALAGLGLIQVPEYDVAEHLGCGELVQVLKQVCVPALPVYAMFPHRNPKKTSVDIFIAWFKTLIAGYAQTQPSAQ